MDRSSMQHEGSGGFTPAVTGQLSSLSFSVCFLLFYTVESLDLPKLDLSLILTFLFYVPFLFLQNAVFPFFLILCTTPFGHLSICTRQRLRQFRNSLLRLHHLRTGM